MTKYMGALLVLVLAMLLVACDSSTNTPVPPVQPTSPIAQPTATTTPLETAPTEAVAEPTALPASSAPSSSDMTVTKGVTTTLLGGFPSGITNVAWSPDGALLAIATGGIGEPSTISATDNIWLSKPDGTLVGAWNDPAGSVSALTWSPDGTLLASGDMNGSVILWGKDGTQQKTLQTNAGHVFALSWSPDGQKLAVGAVLDTSSNTAQIWTLDGTLEKTLHTKFSGGKFYNLQWSPDGKFLAGGATDYGLWDAAGNVITTTLACEQCTPSWGMAWSPDSKLWATGDESGYVVLYNTTGKLTTTLQADSSANVIAWSPDGTKIVVSNSVWKPDGTQIGTLQGMAASTESVAWSPDGKKLAAGDAHGVLGVFNPDRLPLFRFSIGTTIAESPTVNRVAWAPNGLTIAGGYSDNAVRLWYLVR